MYFGQSLKVQKRQMQNLKRNESVAAAFRVAARFPFIKAVFYLDK